MNYFFFIYVLLQFTCATLALKYYDIYAAVAVFGFFIGILIGAFGSAIGHSVTLNDFIRNVVLLGVIGAIGGVISLKFAFFGMEILSFLVERYIAFINS